MPEAGEAPPPRPRRRLSRGKRVLFALLTVVGPFALAEGFFRAREAWRVSRKRESGGEVSPREPDTFRNMVLIPGYRQEEPPSPDFPRGKLVAINSLGMRAREPALPKPPGLVRVLCVGGSSTYGLFTSRNEATWPARTEARLQAAGRQDVEVLDGGAPAWDARTSATNLDLRLWELRPDVLVICHVYNDAVANLDEQYERDSHATSPWGVWQPLRGSALFRFLVSRYHNPRDRLVHKAEAWRPEGLQAYRRNLLFLIRRAREEGARPVLVTEPVCFRPTREESERDGVPGLARWFDELSPFTYPALLDVLAAYCEEVRKLAVEERLPLVDLARRMPHDVRLYLTPVHHSDEGEEVVAGLVAEVLQSSGVLDPPR